MAVQERILEIVGALEREPALRVLPHGEYLSALRTDDDLLTGDVRIGHPVEEVLPRRQRRARAVANHHGALSFLTLQLLPTGSSFSELHGVGQILDVTFEDPPECGILRTLERP